MFCMFFCTDWTKKLRIVNDQPSTTWNILDQLSQNSNRVQNFIFVVIVRFNIAGIAAGVIGTFIAFDGPPHETLHFAYQLLPSKSATWDIAVVAAKINGQ